MRDIGGAYFRIIKLPFELPTPFYGAMLAIWQLNPTLQKQFPLQNSDQKDYLNFLAWCAIRGYKQYAVLRELPGWDEALCCPIVLPKLRGNQWGELFSVGMFFFALVRSQFNLSAVLWNGVYRKKFCLWYWSRTHQGLGFAQLDDWQKQSIEKIFGSRVNFESKHGFKLLIESNSDFVEDLRARVTNFLQKYAYTDFIERYVLGYLPIISFGYVRRYLAERRECPSEQEIIDVCGVLRDSSPVVRSSTLFSDGLVDEVQEGVNLFGYAQGELGIGEDVRMLAFALDGANVPFCIVNVRPGKNVSQKDESVMQWLVDEPMYSVNVFCMTGVEHLRFFLTNGANVFQGRYTIGLWPWELPEWSKPWHHVYGLVHEIWGISRYTASAYVGSNVPIHVVPLPISVEPRNQLSRLDFGLPSNMYLFFFTFDFNSTLTRKNPEAVLKSFMKAFPSNDRYHRVGLVLKVNHVDQKNPAWKKLKKVITSDSRIFLIARSMRRADLLAFYDCCDCLVSLHRAEGFGRVIAEALLLGKQVIATGFSGNMDFCEEDRVALVKSVPVKIDSGEYFFSQGQYWADPDIEHAASLMRKIVNKPRLIGSRVDVLRAYQLKEAGKYYKNRLAKLFKEILAC